MHKKPEAQVSRTCLSQPILGTGWRTQISGSQLHSLFPPVHHICPFGHILQFDNFILIKVIFSNRRKTADSFRWPFPREVTWSQPQVRRDCVICVYSALYSGKGSLTYRLPQGNPASPWAAGHIWASEEGVSSPFQPAAAGRLWAVHRRSAFPGDHGFAFLSEPRFELRGPCVLCLLVSPFLHKRYSKKYIWLCQYKDKYDPGCLQCYIFIIIVFIFPFDFKRNENISMSLISLPAGNLSPVKRRALCVWRVELGVSDKDAT